MQACPTPENVKEVQAFVGIWASCSTFIPHLAQCLCPFYHLVKKEHVRDWGSEQQATVEKAKMLVKQTKALGVSRAGLPLGCMCVTLEGMCWALWQRPRRRECSEDFGTSSGRGQKPDTPREQRPLAAYTALPQVEPLTKKQRILVRTPCLSRGGLRLCSINPPLPRFTLPC